MVWTQIAAALIGLVGVPLGIALGEFLRRRQRAEQFAAAIFAKRVEAYDELINIFHDGLGIANTVIDDPALSSDERHALISAAIAPIAQHVDRNVLYIDEKLGAHCTALFMGLEGLWNLPKEGREVRIDEFRASWLETRRMILEDSGVAKVHGLLRDINRPRITSPVIERKRIRELRSDRR
ncbi:hypothetical protein [Qipengyuania pacifica]|uniref:hypothetical protein n=1 Tax=Qipengyuania pacifica TaxID=2860199 RepID=UPI001C9D7B2E|nr:hypothetical protein [Qipengyuania pacifica]MBY8335034.1 hypothetical protein [Qipengyuania pacifica]